ncbi:MAG: hypothetical protein VB101_07430 [Rhodospirillaceae bacterium]|nr:hypothetical protein [Rhodospirillaceae bacterium]
MLLGRRLGQFFLVLALLMALGDVVMALGFDGPGQGISIADLWESVRGLLPEGGSSWIALPPPIEAVLAQCPAWAVLGLLGLALVLGCRQRRRRRMFY